MAANSRNALIESHRTLEALDESATTRVPELLKIFFSLRMRSLNHACGKVVVDPWIFVTHTVRGERLKVALSFLDESKFEHEDTMIEAAQKMVWVDQETSF